MNSVKTQETGDYEARNEHSDLNELVLTGKHTIQQKENLEERCDVRESNWKTHAKTREHKNQQHQHSEQSSSSISSSHSHSTSSDSTNSSNNSSSGSYNDIEAINGYCTNSTSPPVNDYGTGAVDNNNYVDSNDNDNDNDNATSNVGITKTIDTITEEADKNSSGSTTSEDCSSNESLSDNDSLMIEHNTKLFTKVLKESQSQF